MNNKILRLLYVDDEIDILLSNYLDETYNGEKNKIQKIEFDYSDLEFTPDMSYLDLLNNESIRMANIIIIDSRLFSNDNSSHKYKGEEIELLLRKIYPFIEVVVITQNDIAGRNIVQKYPSSSENDKKNAYEHYQEKLKPIIDEKCKSIASRRLVVNEFRDNNTWDTLMKEKLLNSFLAMPLYEELTKNDIDQLVDSFKQIEKLIDKES